MTAGSQPSFSAAVTAASPCCFGLAFDHAAADFTCVGYVDAISTCASSESGYSAIGASIWSSCSLLNTFVAGADCAKLAVATISASSQIPTFRSNFIVQSPDAGAARRKCEKYPNFATGAVTGSSTSTREHLAG